MEYSEQTPKPQIELERKEYDVPPEIIKPFGLWTKDKLSELNLETEQTLISSDLEKETDPLIISLINEIRNALTKTKFLLEELQFSKEAKLTPVLGDQWKLFLSPPLDYEKPREIKSVKSTITAPYAKAFIAALSDLILNPVSYLRGYSELIENRSSVNEVKEKMRKIKEVSMITEHFLDPFQNAHEIRIEVDENGKVEITPILKSKQDRKETA